MFTGGGGVRGGQNLTAPAVFSMPLIPIAVEFLCLAYSTE